KANPDFTRIVNTRHAERLAGLLDDARSRGAQVIAGGEVDVAARYVEPTLLDGVPMDAAIMQEEIFGPLFPVLAYSDVDRVIAQINAGPKPLALYVYGRDRAQVDHVLRNTSSGGACVNHCILQ